MYCVAPQFSECSTAAAKIALSEVMIKKRLLYSVFIVQNNGGNPKCLLSLKGMIK